MKTRTLLALIFTVIGIQLFAQTAIVAPVDSAKKDSVVVPQVPPTPAVEQTPAPVAEPTEAPSTEPKSEKGSMKSTLDGGLYLRGGLMFPSDKYMTGTANMGYNFQMGSQFYLTPVIANAVRIGLDVTWYDFGYAQYDAANDQVGHSFTISAFGLGPVVSYAIVEDLVFSTYGKALPTFAVSVGEEVVFEDNTIPLNPVLITETVGRGGFCVGAVWGMDLRYKLFNLGFEMEWGKPSVKEVGSKSAYEIKEIKYIIDNTRLYIGLRF